MYPLTHKLANGWPRVVAKNGIQFLDDWPFTFTNTTTVYFTEYPDPPQGDIFRYRVGRLRVMLPDGRQRYLDIGNVSLSIILILISSLGNEFFFLIIDDIPSLPSTSPDMSNTCLPISLRLLEVRFGAKLPLMCCPTPL